MKKITNYLMKSNSLLSLAVIMGGMVSVLARWGCCFYIYHQPHFPEALRDTDE